MTKRVAFFLPHFESGGAEGVVLRVLNGLDRTRFAPELILQDRRGALLERLREDVPVTTLTHPRPPRCVASLSRTVRGRDISLVVTVTNATNLYALAAAALPGRSFATLVMEHTPPLAFLDEAKRASPRRWLMEKLYPRADLAGGPLEEIGEDLTRMMGEKAPPFRRLPNPVVDRTGPLRPIAEPAHHVVSVGRLAPEKRFDLLIDAFAQVHAVRPDARLTIYGDGGERPALEAKIDALELNAAVALPGYVSDMDEAHAQSDLFVCTSRREGLGNAIIEAMARGVPVLSVDCPFGPRHLLKGGRVGDLLTADDAENIARGIVELLGDAERRRRYALAALAEVGEYEAEAAIAGYAEAFDTALASHH